MAIYGTKTYQKDFEINFKEINKNCKGIYEIQVFVTEQSMPLIVKDGTNQVIKHKHNPFVISSPVPIEEGAIRFEFQETHNVISDSIKKAIVRIIYK
ncbi:conserved protein of unknown function [Tenacibaculum sp. 190524A02b]|uniref:hypothetical protein n=1 Tax=Tenacibaculum vairaonense TaxID=3137860 RepID=UPI0032B182DA